MHTFEENFTFNHIVFFLFALFETGIAFLFLSSGGGSGVEPGYIVLGTE